MNNNTIRNNNSFKKKKKKLHSKDIFMIFLGIVSFLYLINPTMGVFEFIPDNIPLIGNIDEAVVVGVIMGVLRYFNIDSPFLTKVLFFFRSRHHDTRKSNKTILDKNRLIDKP